MALSDELLINVTPTECRVAVVESGLVQELYLERRDLTSVVGRIYLGRVERVLPGMQAAFIQIGLARTAFLHMADLLPRDLETCSEDSEVSGPQERVLPSISEHLSPGQMLPVQVIKDPLGSKGARLSAQLSIPSRYLVLLPNSTHIGISVRIEDESERERLRTLTEEMTGPDRSVGLIIRTNAEGVTRDELLRDFDYLMKRWDRVMRDQSVAAAGDCIFEDLSLPVRSLRDLMHTRVDRVRIDDASTFEVAVDFAKEFFPDGVSRIEHYTRPRPLFDLFGVEAEIERALSRTTPLKSGGHLVIDQTEAMTTVDVNTGGYVGTRNPEETIFKTNLEAAQAIARQLRLRNLGGIIIIDFIDMIDEEHKQQVLRVLNHALEKDPARTSVSEISPLGLVEMTRKRTTESLEHRLCEPCQVCLGTGRVKTAETVCSEIFREVVRATRQFETGQLQVMAAPKVIEKLLEDHDATVAELTDRLGTAIRFQPHTDYAPDQFDVVLL